MRTQGQETQKPCICIHDYNGAVNIRERNEIVLKRIVGGAWRPLVAKAQADRRSHPEGFGQQIRLIRASRENLLGALVAGAEPAPGLAVLRAELEARSHLAERCAAEGLDWRPLSDFARVWSEVDAWMAGR